jgi:hypothetical protein
LYGFRFDLIENSQKTESLVLYGTINVEQNAKLFSVLQSIGVYLIKDQRLIQNILPKRDGTFERNGTLKRDSVPVAVNTIQIYSTELMVLISNKKNEEQQFAEQLSVTQYNRIKTLEVPLQKAEFESRFGKLILKYRQLLNLGVYSVDIENTDYESDKRYLSVFLEDWEKRTEVYDDLRIKINLFLELLNKKHLTNKKASVMAGGGFCFLTNDNNKLDLSALSSGEQHETILLYELIFKAPPDSLVLIDEPETSLHVVWQHEFISDLEKIININPLSFLIATHSPSIINGNWDLSQDLFDKAEGKEHAV